MKVKQIFNPNLTYQIDAVNSIVDIFKDVDFDYSISDKNIYHNIFSLNSGSYTSSNPTIKEEYFKKLIINNIKNIQRNNQLEEIDYLDPKDLIFDIEMETGTGKTYVYLRTILELYKKYKYKKFIILVPNKAVKETIQSSFKSYANHFSSLYSETNYNYEYYDSKSLDIVKVFSNSIGLEILIMNIQQINKIDANDKNTNNIYKAQDYLYGSTALELIQQTNPVLIIDEPQSTASGLKSSKAISELNASFIIRYSATFRKRSNEILMYKLDAVDAYKLNLVKKISVFSCDNENSDEIKIIKLDNKNLSATIQLEMFDKTKLEWNQKQIKVFKSTDLFNKTNNEKYKGLIIEEINFKDEKIIFTNGKEIVQGATYDIKVKAAQIKATIESHLNRQLELLDKNIKVLSLFFIDKVSNYRIYNDDKSSSLGIYGEIFKNALRELLLKNDKYKKLLGNKTVDDYISSCHDGYFSRDSKGRFIDSAKNGDSLNDQSTYEIIMKDKEGLLSFDQPLSFIFSHTALKEGWDNPNVFQICTLNETTSKAKMHQEIGRGLRLCVNQFGERIIDENLNQLTVVINFSYKDFVSSLQSEMENMGVNFGELSINSFIFKDIDDETKYISFEQSKDIYHTLVKDGVIDSKTKKLNLELKNDFRKTKLLLLNKFTWDSEKLCDSVVNKLLSSLNREIKIANAKKKINNNLNKDVLYSHEFKSLWEEIKYKSRYFISFDDEKFINEVINEFKNRFNNFVEKQSISIIKSNIEISHDTGVVASNVGTYDKYTYENNDFNKKLLTIVSDLEKETNLKRKTIVKILTNNEILKVLSNVSNSDLKTLFKTIKFVKRKLIYENIRYEKTNESYDLEQFSNCLSIDFSDGFTYNVKNKYKYPYDFIDLDSKVEYNFAKNADDSQIVQVFIKLPTWYKITTPYNSYNPDWSLLCKDDLISVIETKGNSDVLELRLSESEKINCAKRHFEAISNKIKYEVKQSLDK